MFEGPTNRSDEKKEKLSGNPFRVEALMKLGKILAVAGVVAANAEKAVEAAPLPPQEVSIEQVEDFQKRIKGLRLVFDTADHVTVFQMVKDAPLLDRDSLEEFDILNEDFIKRGAPVVQLRKNIETEGAEVYTVADDESLSRSNSAWANGFPISFEGNSYVVTNEHVAEAFDVPSIRLGGDADAAAFQTEILTAGNSEFQTKISDLGSNWQEKYTDMDLHAQAVYTASISGYTEKGQGEDAVDIFGGVAFKISDNFAKTFINNSNDEQPLSAEEKAFYQDLFEGSYGLVVRAVDFNRDGVANFKDYKGLSGAPMFTKGVEVPVGFVFESTEIRVGLDKGIILFFHGPDVINEMLHVADAERE